MKTLNMYEKILYLALTKNLITNTAFLLISESSQSVYRVIRTAIENGHLKKQTDDFSDSDCKFILTYYYITSSGIKYLIENASDKILWLKFFTPFFSRFKTKGKYSSKRKLEKFLHTTTAAIMCEEIGARSSSYFLTTDTLSFFNTKSSKDWAVNEEIELDLSRKVQSENTQNDFLIITAGFSSAAAEAVGKLETLFSTFPRLKP